MPIMAKNILVFMTDQQLGDTILPSHMAKTPNVDRLRKNGMQFTSAYCPAPHCCPSRATFFTGLYPSEHNIWNNVEVDNALSRTFYGGVVTFPEELKQAGYQTIFSGKWHVSGYEGPADRGFDEVLYEYISNYGRMKPNNLPPVNHDWKKAYADYTDLDHADSEKHFGQIIREGYPTYYQFGTNPSPFGDKETVQLACERLKKQDHEKPFFMYVGTVGPHDPYFPPQEFLDMYPIEDIEFPPNFHDDMMDVPGLYRRTKKAFALTEQEHKESIRRYLAFCSYEDSLFGRILDTLEQENMMNDTVVIYLSDHGDYVGAHGLWAKGLPCYREAYQICAVIGGGNIVSHPVQCDELVSLSDMAPTILDLAGVKDHTPTTGVSLLPLLQGTVPADWRTDIYTQTNGNELYGIQRAVWNKKWKYVYNGFDFDQLYDLEADPLEMHNLAEYSEYQPIIRKMCKKMWKFARDHNDPITCPYIMVALAPYGPGITLEAESHSDT